MELIHNKIKLLVEQNKLSVRKLCSDLGISEVGFNKMFKAKSLKVSTLQEIAKYLNVPTYNLLGEEIEVKNNTYSLKDVNINHVKEGEIHYNKSTSQSDEIIKQLELRLADKEKIIKMLENEIAKMLEKKKD